MSEDRWLNAEKAAAALHLQAVGNAAQHFSSDLSKAAYEPKSEAERIWQITRDVVEGRTEDV